VHDAHAARRPRVDTFSTQLPELPRRKGWEKTAEGGAALSCITSKKNVRVGEGERGEAGEEEVGKEEGGCCGSRGAADARGRRGKRRSANKNERQ